MDFSALTSGAPIPTVTPGDLRGVCELVHEARAESGGQQPAISIDIKLLTQVSGPGADVLAVWVRSVLLYSLVEQGRLTSWRCGTQLADAVFDVAATFPIPRSDRFDPEAFFQELGSRRG